MAALPAAGNPAAGAVVHAVAAVAARAAGAGARDSLRARASSPCCAASDSCLGNNTEPREIGRPGGLSPPRHARREARSRDACKSTRRVRAGERVRVSPFARGRRLVARRRGREHQQGRKPRPHADSRGPLQRPRLAPAIFAERDVDDSSARCARDRLSGSPLGAGRRGGARRTGVALPSRWPRQGLEHGSSSARSCGAAGSRRYGLATRVVGDRARLLRRRLGDRQATELLRFGRVLFLLHLLRRQPPARLLARVGRALARSELHLAGRAAHTRARLPHRNVGSVSLAVCAHGRRDVEWPCELDACLRVRRRRARLGDDLSARARPGADDHRRLRLCRLVRRA